MHVTRALPITKELEERKEVLKVNRIAATESYCRGQRKVEEERDDIGRREGPGPFIRFTVEQIRTYV